MTTRKGRTSGQVAAFLFGSSSHMRKRDNTKEKDERDSLTSSPSLLPSMAARNGKNGTRNSVAGGCAESVANLSLRTVCYSLGFGLCLSILYLVLAWMFPRTMYHKLMAWKEIRTMLEDAPAPVNDDYVVFVTNAGLGPGTMHVGMGRDSDSAEGALEKALGQLPLQSAVEHPWFKVDVVTAVHSEADFDYSKTYSSPPSWWYGLALDWQRGWVFLPDEVHAHGLMDQHQLRWDNLAYYAKEVRRLHGFPSGVTEDDATTLPKLDFLHTNSILVDFQMKVAVPVYHGHRLFEKLTHSLLMDHAKEAGRYLTRMHSKSGKQTYLYEPRSDHKPDDYNLTRHAGVLYAMACLYAEWADPDLLQAMKNGFSYLMSFIYDCKLPFDSTVTAKCVWDFERNHRITKLGVNALTVLAMATYQDATHDDRYYSTAVSIAEWMVGAQKEDGTFVQKVQQPSNERNEDYFVRYYQGETCYALARLYNVAKRSGKNTPEQWLLTADKAAVYIIHRDNKQEESNVLIDHWLLYGIAEMHVAGYNHHQGLKQDYAMFVVGLLHRQQWQELKPDDFDKDRLGTFKGSISATSSAAKTEGICAVHHLAMEADLKDKLDMIRRITDLSARFQLQEQFRPERAMYMKNPELVLGGFHASLEKVEMRNDYTQHNLSSLLCAAHLLKEHEAAWSS